MNKNIIENILRGGARKGAGRKPASYQTKTISFRVRVEWESEIRQLVKDKLNELANNCS